MMVIVAVVKKNNCGRRRKTETMVVVGRRRKIETMVVGRTTKSGDSG